MFKDEFQVIKMRLIDRKTELTIITRKKLMQSKQADNIDKLKVN